MFYKMPENAFYFCWLLNDNYHLYFRSAFKNVYEQIHGMHPTPVTHLVKGDGERYFDHGFASRHCIVIDSGYHHEWRKSGLSEHSALWFEIRSQKTNSLTDWDKA